MIHYRNSSGYEPTTPDTTGLFTDLLIATSVSFLSVFTGVVTATVISFTIKAMLFIIKAII